ncbi:histidine phosphatase family protein [Cytophaga aurantiaca]|uniref:histidine phosphatase family protein n=1 Tax=Cytophaga aurantiaca TaxID=29530 RepID=UPI0003673C73|nr:histidine phosphatase family protein [Cytophaga aurantiaca]
MSTKKIYLVRHGQTEFNKKGIVQGSAVNSSLNDTGRAQADAFYQAYKHIPFDVVYTSALNRSIESVQAFIDESIPHYIRPGLNEISWGDMDGKLATATEHNEYKDLLQRWQQGDIEFKMWGGESPVDVQRRQEPVIQEILNSEYETILMCMHGRAIRILLSHITNTSLAKMDQFEHSNLCLYVLEGIGERIEIVCSNDQRHLLGLA